MAARKLIDVREATISSLHQALLRRETTCREITRAHLARINALDGSLRSVIFLNPNVLDEADALDREFAASAASPPVSDHDGEGTSALASSQQQQQQQQLHRRRLFGIPTLLKDNFDVAGMPTSGGSLALQDSYPPRDAAVVRALKEAGALILGKANTHEFVLEGLTVSSLGGQTVNPYDLTRTPGGSSGGSGAALAASLAVLATGSDTVNSLRSPASANAVCSCRPSRGLISHEGVMPVSSTQDVVGPMARTVRDVATALGVMLHAAAAAGKLEDGSSAHTTAAPDFELLDAATDKRDLGGVKVGLVTSFLASDGSEEGEEVNAAMRSAVDVFRGLGASVVELADASSVFDADEIRSTLDTQRYEYRENMDAYLRTRQTRAGDAHPTTSLQQILYGQPETAAKSRRSFLVVPSQYEFIRQAMASSTRDAAYARIKTGIDALAARLHETFERHGLDALIYPQQRHLVVQRGAASQTGRNGILAALTGCPVVAVPMGYSRATRDAPVGVPIGMEILGPAATEARLLRIAHVFEQRTLHRRPPVYADVEVDAAMVNTVVPVETPPSPSNISSNYPQGTLSTLP